MVKTCFVFRYPISREFRGKVKILSTHNLLCRKCSPLCRQIATSCGPSCSLYYSTAVAYSTDSGDRESRPFREEPETHLYFNKWTKHQFIHLLTATLINSDIENSKNHKRWYCPHHTDCVSMCCWIISPFVIFADVLYNYIYGFYARQQNASRVFAIVWASVCPSVRPSVRLSVRLSHSWSVSKRCKLGSRNLHCGLPQGL